MQSPVNLTTMFSAIAAIALLCCAPAYVSAQSEPTGAAPQTNAPQRRSALPDAALQKAREAEQHLAANEPDKAISILREIDKKYPDHSAISLRLAQINDTLNRYGYALFYYRRYIQQAGPNAREMAAARVGSLELMPGIDDNAEKVAKELGQTTRPVATPAPQRGHALFTEAKDGSRVPIRNEEDFNRIQKQGVPKTAPSTPIPTPEPAIVLPQKLAPAQTPASAIRNNISPALPSQTSSRTTATPRPADEDALLAEAFRQADSPGSITASMEADDENAPVENSAKEPRELVKLNVAQAEVQSTPQTRSTPTHVSPRLTPSAPVATPEAIAFTSQTPNSNTPRAANFFNITPAPGKIAQVALVNEIPNAVVTLSITPKDAGEVISGILMPGETKTLFVKPANYDVTANVSTTDYSPITLMNTQFEYSFAASRQYTHRFNKSSIQQLN